MKNGIWVLFRKLTMVQFCCPTLVNLRTDNTYFTPSFAEPPPDLWHPQAATARGRCHPCINRHHASTSCECASLVHCTSISIALYGLAYLDNGLLHSPPDRWIELAQSCRAVDDTAAAAAAAACLRLCSSRRAVAHASSTERAIPRPDDYDWWVFKLMSRSWYRDRYRINIATPSTDNTIQ